MIRKLASLWALLALVAADRVHANGPPTVVRGLQFDEQATSNIAAGKSGITNVNGANRVVSGMADGASAKALVVNTTTAWSNATAYLIELLNNSVQKFAVTAAGKVITPAVGTSTSTFHNLPSGTGDVAVLDVAQTYSASQNVASVALSDGANIATNAALGNVFTVTLGGNRTLDNPTNLVAGGTYLWVVTQDGTGSRTLAYGANFKWPGGTAPTLTTAASSVDMISCVYTGTTLKCVAQADFR
jgi:hypothetical protein